MTLLEYMESITTEMTKRVDELKSSNFKDATPEDIQMYAEWYAAVKMQEKHFEERQQEERELFELKKAAFEEQAKTSADVLKARKEAAMKKLELVSNGKA